jgi:predicted RNA binding protein YcfA (HicA-like mRNA interferase family)
MPSWKQLKRFCEKDGWELYKKTGHYFYRKVDENGNIRRTRVSMGSGEIHNHLWREILYRQLQVTQEYFNEHN